MVHAWSEAEDEVVFSASAELEIAASSGIQLEIAESNCARVVITDPGGALQTAGMRDGNSIVAIDGFGINVRSTTTPFEGSSNTGR